MKWTSFVLVALVMLFNSSRVLAEESPRPTHFHLEIKSKDSKPLGDANTPEFQSQELPGFAIQIHYEATLTQNPVTQAAMMHVELIGHFNSKLPLTINDKEIFSFQKKQEDRKFTFPIDLNQPSAEITAMAVDAKGDISKETLKLEVVADELAAFQCNYAQDPKNPDSKCTAPTDSVSPLGLSWKQAGLAVLGAIQSGGRDSVAPVASYLPRYRFSTDWYAQLQLGVGGVRDVVDGSILWVTDYEAFAGWSHLKPWEFEIGGGMQTWIGTDGSTYPILSGKVKRDLPSKLLGCIDSAWVEYSDYLITSDNAQEIQLGIGFSF